MIVKFEYFVLSRFKILIVFIHYNENNGNKKEYIIKKKIPFVRNKKRL